MQNRVVALEIESDERADQMKVMQGRIEELEQRERAKNLIVTGIKKRCISGKHSEETQQEFRHKDKGRGDSLCSQVEE